MRFAMSAQSAVLALGASLLFGSPAVLGQSLPALTSAPSAATTSISASARAALQSRLAREGQARAIVTLRLAAGFRPGGHLAPGQAQAQRQAIAERQDQLLRELGAGVSRPIRFADVPQVAMDVNAAAFARLLASPLVESVADDELLQPMLDTSVPRIGAPLVWSSGMSGEGQAIAVLDTGVAKAHPMLAGAVVFEACYSNAGRPTAWGTPEYQSLSLCPGGMSYEGVGSAEPYGLCFAPLCDHGTQVAGIAAGRASGGYKGVAPAAKVLAFQVFTQFDDRQGGGPICGGAICVRAYTSDIMAAMQRVIGLRTSMSIAAVNLSLGGGASTTPCDGSDPRKPLIDSLRSYGIATVAPAGNGGYANALTAPACVSTAVSVGATMDSDQVDPSSNSASFLTLLAPGNVITAPVPQGFANGTGTSMAAPHVSGAFALIKQARPRATVSDIVSALSSTGLSVADPKNGLAKPRIRVNLAASVLPFNDGWQALGLFGSGIWYLELNGNRAWDGTPTDMQNFFGQAGDIPVVGDWNNNAVSKVGVFRQGVWYLDYNGNGVWDGPVEDRVYAFGQATDIPVVGVWTAGGPTKIGVFRNGAWYLDLNGNGAWDGVATDALRSFGASGDVPVVGDWSGNGVSKLGIFRSGGQWYLDYNGNGVWNGAGTDTYLVFGGSGDIPVAGDWNGTGVDKVGVYRNGAWYLDHNANGVWNGAVADELFTFGSSSHKPLVGRRWQLIIN